MLLDIAACTIATVTVGPAYAGPGGPSSSTPAGFGKARATALYNEGIALADQGKWDEALARFLEARRLYSSWKITSWTATCLDQAGRYDEALETFEDLLREFGRELSPEVKAKAQGKIEEMRHHVGVLDVDGAEPGATVTVDGRPRGAYPLPGPLRLTAGTHVVVVYIEGFKPFVASVDIAVQRLARLDARLLPLGPSGRLRVAEAGGRALEVLVDGSVVGKTPWEGVLAPEEHVVMLRGEGNLGTPPVRVNVAVGRTAPLTLEAEELEAALRIVPVPANARVAIDGVTVGQGIWEGRVRAGTHQIEIAAPGFRSDSRQLVLKPRQGEVVRVAMERDESSLFWHKPPRRSRFLVEAATSVVIVPTFGGDVAGVCGASCATAPGAGGSAVVHDGYELGLGLGFGVSLGSLAVAQSIRGRSATVQSVGRVMPSAGVVDDRLSLRGALVGGWLGYTLGERVPLHFRLGAGAFVSSLLDERTNGAFQASDGKPFAVGPLIERHLAAFAHLTPEVRVSLPLGAHVELNAGIAVHVLIAMSQPRWDPSLAFGTGDDGVGAFARDALVSPVLFAIAPGIGARYDL